MHCREVEEVVEHQGLEALPEAARTHAKDCPACSGLLSDLTQIVALAHQLPAEVTPPDRVWISLRAQMEAEGLIKEQPVSVERVAWWRIPIFVGNRGLVGAAVGFLLLAGAVQIYRHPATPAHPAIEQEAGVVPQKPIGNDSLEQTSQTLRQAEIDLSNMQQAGTSPAGRSFSSLGNASLQQNLKAVDDFIVECEEHLRRDPADQLAHEYLSRAYQQKAELLSALLDSGRSEN